MSEQNMLVGLPALRDALMQVSGGPVTVAKLAKASGVGRSTLFSWLAGEVEPTVGAWFDVAAAVGADPVELWVNAGGVSKGPAWEARVRLGWSPSDLAARAGVSKRSVLAVEAGQPVRSDAGARMARALGRPWLVAAVTASAKHCSRVGDLLEQTRVSRGLSRAEFSCRLGVSRQLYSAWVSGAEVLPESRVSSVAGLCGCDDQWVAWARDEDLSRHRLKAQHVAPV